MGAATTHGVSECMLEKSRLRIFSPRFMILSSVSSLILFAVYSLFPVPENIESWLLSPSAFMAVADMLYACADKAG